MDETNTEHSKAGIASLVVALLPIVVLAIVVPLIVVYVSSLPPGADTVAVGFGVLMLMLVSAVSEIIAVGLGTVGVLRQRRKRLFAFLGITCSSLALLALVFYFAYFFILR